MQDTNIVKTSEEILKDLDNLFDLESFGQTLTIIKEQLSNSYINNIHHFLESILKFKIHRYKSEEPHKYASAIRRKLSIALDKKLSTKKIQLFLKIAKPLLDFIKNNVEEIIKDEDDITLEFNSISISEGVNIAFEVIPSIVEIPNIMQTYEAIQIKREIDCDFLIFQIEALKEQISLLTRYSQEVAKSIVTLKKQVDLKNPKERKQLDDLKTQEKTLLVQLAGVIGQLAGIYAHIQYNNTTSYDHDMIDELFDMNIHVAAPTIDPIFVKIIEGITTQISKKPTIIDARSPIKGLVPDSDLSYFKKITLASEFAKIVQRGIVIFGDVVKLFSDNLPNNSRFKRQAPPHLSNKQTKYTRAILGSELVLNTINAYNSVYIFLTKKNQIEKQITNMHKEFIEDVFKFLGNQVTLDSDIQTLYYQYKTILDTVALHKQGIKSDFEYSSEKYNLYDKILKLYNSKIELMKLYTSIRLTYNLPTKILLSSFESETIKPDFKD